MYKLFAEGGISGFDWFNSDLTVGDAFLIFIFGFVAVFIVLSVLVGLVYLIRRRRVETAVPPAAQTQLNGVCDEEVAAVMAALMAYFESERIPVIPESDDAPPFVVRRIYRKS